MDIFAFGTGNFGDAPQHVGGGEPDHRARLEDRLIGDDIGVRRIHFESADLPRGSRRLLRQRQPVLLGRAQPLLPRNWSDISTMTISYGHGLSASPLHLASAYASLLNGGTKVEPTLILRDTYPARCRGGDAASQAWCAAFESLGKDARGKPFALNEQSGDSRISGSLASLVGLGGYMVPAVRDAEDLLPDHDAG